MQRCAWRIDKSETDKWTEVVRVTKIDLDLQ